LLDTLWAYKNLSKSVTGFLPFSLVYKTEIISPAEVMTPSLRFMQMQTKEKEKGVFTVERCKDRKGLDEKTKET